MCYTLLLTSKIDSLFCSAQWMMTSVLMKNNSPTFLYQHIHQLLLHLFKVIVIFKYTEDQLPLSLLPASSWHLLPSSSDCQSRGSLSWSEWWAHSEIKDTSFRDLHKFWSLVSIRANKVFIIYTQVKKIEKGKGFWDSLYTLFLWQFQSSPSLLEGLDEVPPCDGFLASSQSHGSFWAHPEPWNWLGFLPRCNVAKEQTIWTKMFIISWAISCQYERIKGQIQKMWKMVSQNQG